MNSVGEWVNDIYNHALRGYGYENKACINLAQVLGQRGRPSKRPGERIRSPPLKNVKYEEQSFSNWRPCKKKALCWKWNEENRFSIFQLPIIYSVCPQICINYWSEMLLGIRRPPESITIVYGKFGGQTQWIRGKRPLSIYWNSAWLWGLKDTNKENWMTMFVHFFCWCPPGVAIKLNWKVASWKIENRVPCL